VATYSPSWCPTVVGTFDREVDPETGRPEPTWVHLICGICGEKHQVKCESGAPTQWVLRFATNHLHRDPLKEKPR
jgi:hypothetical protein